MLRMLRSALRRGTYLNTAIPRTPAPLSTPPQRLPLSRRFSLLCKSLQPHRPTRPKLSKAPKAIKPPRSPRIFKASKQSEAKTPHKTRKLLKPPKGPVLSETQVTFELPVSPENPTASKSPPSSIHPPFDKLLIMVRAADVVSRMEMPEELPDFPLPPLPDIYDRELLRQVFTHTSYVGARKQSALFDKEAFHHDNEKLEHVGDALLGCIVTCLLHDLYPNLNPGNATEMKAICVCNQTLSQLSRRYKMPERLITDVNATEILKNGTKTTANIFEAYVAGLHYSYLKHGNTKDVGEGGGPKTHGQGLEHLQEWLRPLFEPIAEWVLGYMKKEQERLEAETAVKAGSMDTDLDDLANGASGKLNELFISRGAGMPVYTYEQRGVDMWKAIVIARNRDGKEWQGEATRTKKKQAATVAAYKILMQLEVV
ncbi:ribonuclease III [Cryptococcus neoformans c45]|nr:ribonuclease III [Cryptococcus neoformans var. grubii c45]